MLTTNNTIKLNDNGHIRVLGRSGQGKGKAYDDSVFRVRTIEAIASENAEIGKRRGWEYRTTEEEISYQLSKGQPLAFAIHEASTIYGPGPGGDQLRQRDRERYDNATVLSVGDVVTIEGRNYEVLPDCNDNVNLKAIPNPR